MKRSVERILTIHAGRRLRQFAGSTEIHPRVVWARLEALAEGARLATRRLWPRG
jgi:hypothetical protein